MRYAFFISLTLPAVSSAATLTVGSSGTYSTINDAVLDATDGDLIEVSAGTYNESVIIDGIDLSIVSVDGSGSTFISAQNTALQIADSEDFSVSGFTLSSSTSRGFTISESLGTISDIVAENITITEMGAGGYITSSTVEITDSIFNNNSVNDNIGGHLCILDSDVDIESSSFDNGTAYKGGAVYVGQSSTVTIDLSTFAANTVSGQSNNTGAGGAIRCSDSEVTVTNSSFDSDTAGNESNGGVFGVREGYITLNDVTMSNNTAERDGGAIYLDDSSLTATNLTITNGFADYKGGAIAAFDNSSVDVSESSFTGNQAPGSSSDNSTWSGSGGAFYLEDSTISISDSSLEANTSAVAGGAIYTNEDIIISNTSFDDHESSYGGAIYLDDSSALISDSSFSNNSASTSGGGIRWRDDSEIASVTITNTLFSNNDADEYGGAFAFIYGDETVLSDNSFFNNTALYGGAISLAYIDGLSGVRNNFCANTASYHAGAMRINNSGSDESTWTNNVYIDNIAGTEGGGIYLQDADDMSFVNNTILGNEAEDGGSIWVSGNTDIEFINNIVASTVDGNAIEGGSGANFDIDYSDFYSNSPGDIAGSTSSSIGPNSIASDPKLTYVSLDGVCGNDQLWPTSTSPVIDAGDPSITDPDGSISDMGAYGGPDGFILDTDTDNDGDGYTVDEDCNDSDPAIYPGATEICNGGVDDDCDGYADGADATGQVSFYWDFDSDGFGDASISVQACSAPNGYVSDDTDCEDSNGTVYPGAEELCDKLDNDCNNLVDDNVSNPPAWYPDLDMDGYGDSTEAVDQCESPIGYINVGEDCNDANPSINPAAIELCNNVDDDCNGIIDDEATDGDRWYLDLDEDNYGDPDTSILACGKPDGYVENNTDCDDSSLTTYPGAPEECTSTIDNNCDGTAGDPDLDEDGFVECDDCNDSDPAINPAATEVWYDGIDQDCDEGSDFDQDTDGFDFIEYGGTDCDDLDPSINPDAEDIKGDEIDSNCDGKDGINPKANDPWVAEDLEGFSIGCGCSSASNPVSLALFLPFLLAFIRRQEPVSCP